MNGSAADWAGLFALVLMAAFLLLGLKLLSRRKERTEEEFEKGAAESASLLSAGVNALNGMLHPSAGKGKTAVEELKQGRYDSKEGEKDDRRL